MDLEIEDTTIPASSDDIVHSYPPWNFSWIVENEIAGMAWPQTEGNLEYLVQQGIKHLITLSPEKLPPILTYRKLDWTQIPIKEFRAPSIKDIIKFIDVCQRCHLKNQAVGIHCRMGRGRTGVMGACYLVHFHGLSPERAITNIRLHRAGSVETPEQERAVKRYHDCLRGMKITEIQNIEDQINQTNY